MVRKPRFRISRALIGIVIVILFILTYTVFFSQSKLISNDISCTECNVIIVGYDTVSAKHVSSIGYEKETTPMLDKLATEGYLFTQNISPAPWTVPAFMSLFTGLYPTEHKVINKFTVFTPYKKEVSNLTKLSPNVLMLAQVMKEKGYVTGGFTGDAGVSGQFGYSNGFDIYTEDQRFGSIGNSAKHALEWLKKNHSKKFFMFLHGYDAHGQASFPEKGMFIPTDYKGPFNGSPEEEAKLREDQLSAPLEMTENDVAFWKGLYDSKIRAGDDKFAEFWNEVKKMGLDKNTIVIVVADHGEEFYQHRGIDHGHTLYDEQVHVPLVFRIPGVEGGKKIVQQVTSLDIVPTLFDILNIEPNSQYKSQQRGKSLLPLMLGDQFRSEDVYLETDYRDFTHKRGIRTTDGWKYILTFNTGVQELYDLNKDPGETTNLVNSNPEIASSLEKKVKQHMLQMGQNPGQKWSVGCLPVYVGECE